MLALSLPQAPPESPLRTRIPGMSHRPAFTHLVLLATADPGFAGRLLSDPVSAAQSHRHYPIQLSAGECALLADLCANAHSAEELLCALAECADGPPGSQDEAQPLLP
jgi:hypothetical protein